MSLKEELRRLSDERWNIGFFTNSLESIIFGGEIKVNWLEHSVKRSWFADPFILDVTPNEILILVEEFTNVNHKGRISKLTVDRKTNELKGIDVVLELPTHLSFPVIIRQETEFGKKLNGVFKTHIDNDFVYLMPENGESGKLTIYEFYPQTNSIKQLGTVLNEAVEDAVPVSINNETYLFCTPRENPNGNELHVYIWNQETAKFTFLKKITFNENVARMAGSFFTYNGKLFRPTQECNMQYGHAITLEEVKTKEPQLTDIEFKELRRIYSTNSKLNTGTHTFNSYKGIIVTDSLGFDNIWIRKILKKINLLH